MQKKFLIEVTIEADNEELADQSQLFLVSRSNSMAPITMGPGKGVKYELKTTEEDSSAVYGVTFVLMVLSGIFGAIIG